MYQQEVRANSVFMGWNRFVLKILKLYSTCLFRKRFKTLWNHIMFNPVARGRSSVLSFLYDHLHVILWEFSGGYMQWNYEILLGEPGAWSQMSGDAQHQIGVYQIICCNKTSEKTQGTKGKIVNQNFEITGNNHVGSQTFTRDEVVPLALLKDPTDYRI